jgi:uncharacterized membrane protein
MIISCFLGLYVATSATERKHLASLQGDGMRSAIATGLIIAAGYSMVLASMAYVTNVSYIAAFRQISIPLGAMLGIMVQREPLYTTKLIGIVVVLAGLVIVALA